MNTSKNFLIIAVVVCVVLAGALILYGLLVNWPSTVPTQTSTGSNTTGTTVGSNNSSSVTVTPNQNQTGSSGQSTSATMTVTSQNGQSIVVNDFKSDPATLADPNNKGFYYLSGGLAPIPSSTSYSTFYVDADQSFNITLLKEPLGNARTQAQAELQQKLGISQAQMCNLKYWVGVPEAVNEIYAGKNLGFSFCPGATQL